MIGIGNFMQLVIIVHRIDPAFLGASFHISNTFLYTAGSELG